MRYVYDHPRPAVTADAVVLTIGAGALSVLLVRRARAPFKGAWALPGGFVDASEPLDVAAARELAEETRLTAVPLEQLAAFGDPGRDPRGHTVSVAYWGWVAAPQPVAAGDDAAAAEWHAVRALPRMAFDHARMVALAVERLRARLGEPRPWPTAIVPEHFTLSELQRVHEAVLGRPLDKRNFRGRLLARGLVEPVAARRTGRHRPAQLYRFAAPASEPAAPAAPSASRRARAAKRVR